MVDYLELYKKYRPRRWDDVIGHAGVVRSLKECVSSGRVPTGFLFSGGAGTGKTTLALLLAKVLNCDNVDEGLNPCNACEICKGIDSNSLLGIKYISMANNGSADDVRRIMEESRMAYPIRKKVFILDEVHNCSSAAQDAMLIGLESDTQSTLFICCTTDPDKVKPAILSRLQQRVLRPPSVAELTQNLVKIAKCEPEIVEKIKSGVVSREMIVQCAQLANGSVRNSITNFEMVLSSGILPTGFSLRLLEAVASGDPVVVYRLTEEMDAEGVDFNRAIEGVYEGLVDLLKFKSGGVLSDPGLSDIADRFSAGFILRCLDELGKVLGQVSNRVVKYRILYEVCFTKLALLFKKSCSV